MPSRLRAAVLAAAMNLGSAAPADPFRGLRVPAIHFVLRLPGRRRDWWRPVPRRRSRWRH